jgi:hypothetical protein
VSGTSTGAITAAVLGGARGDPIRALERLWRQKLTVSAPFPGWWPAPAERSLALLGNPGMYRLRGELLYAPWASSSLYDTAPLRDTLAELVDVDTLNTGDIRVILGAVDVATGEEAPVPRTMAEVLQRMVQLQYMSRLKLDRAFFGTIDRLVDLVQRIDAALPADSDIRQDACFQELRAHRKIDRFHVVTATFPSELADANDFSPASIDARIRAGYDDAIAQCPAPDRGEPRG